MISDLKDSGEFFLTNRQNQIYYSRATSCSLKLVSSVGGKPPYLNSSALSVKELSGEPGAKTSSHTP